MNFSFSYLIHVCMEKGSNRVLGGMVELKTRPIFLKVARGKTGASL